MNSLLSEEVNTAFMNISNDIADIAYNNGMYDWLFGFFTLSIDENQSCIISFLKMEIWCSENDERDYVEDNDEYEPLEPYLRKEIKKILTMILSFIAIKI